MELKENETLEDLLIDGLKIIQSKDLYRFSSDAVLLSKFASFKKGDKVTIMGDFAETYVRKRDTNTINASLNRTARQSQYIKAYAEQLRKAVTSDFSTVSNLYNTASKYSQTNISLSDVTYFASVVLQHGVTEVNQYTIDGEMKASSEVSEDVFAEYYADSDSVMEIVLNCFYQQVS